MTESVPPQPGDGGAGARRERETVDLSDVEVTDVTVPTSARSSGACRVPARAPGRVLASAAPAVPAAAASSRGRPPCVGVEHARLVQPSPPVRRPASPSSPSSGPSPGGTATRRLRRARTARRSRSPPRP